MSHTVILVGLVEHEFAAVLVDCVVGQVHVQIVQVVVSWRLVFFGGETR